MEVVSTTCQRAAIATPPPSPRAAMTTPPPSPHAGQSSPRLTASFLQICPLPANALLVADPNLAHPAPLATLVFGQPSPPPPVNCKTLHSSVEPSVTATLGMLHPPQPNHPASNIEYTCVPVLQRFGCDLSQDPTMREHVEAFGDYSPALHRWRAQTFERIKSRHLLLQEQDHGMPDQDPEVSIIKAAIQDRGVSIINAAITTTQSRLKDSQVQVPSPEYHRLTQRLAALDALLRQLTRYPALSVVGGLGWAFQPDAPRYCSQYDALVMYNKKSNTHHLIQLKGNVELQLAPPTHSNAHGPSPISFAPDPSLPILSCDLVWGPPDTTMKASDPSGVVSAASTMVSGSSPTPDSDHVNSLPPDWWATFGWANNTPDSPSDDESPPGAI